MAKSSPNYLYTDDGGKTHPIRISTVTAGAQTTAATQGTADLSNHARVSGSRRKFGLNARFATLGNTVTGGTGATAVTRTYTTKFPVLKTADFNALAVGSTVTIGSIAYKVLSKTAESLK